jgi:hypothetical protein
MKRAIGILFGAAVLSALVTSPAAAASFGLHDLGVSISTSSGTPALQAGSHPYAMQTNVAVNTELNAGSGKVVPSEEAKDMLISFPPGLVGNPTAVPRCSAEEFLAGLTGECSNTSAVGVARIEFGEPGAFVSFPLYNLAPSPGAVATVGFIVEQRAPVTIDLRVSEAPPYNVVASLTNISQALFFFSGEVTVWGVPASSVHDPIRGTCLGTSGNPTGKDCSVSIPEKPFLTLPTSCDSPLSFGFEADSWQHPTAPPYPFAGTAAVGEDSAPPTALSPTGCAKLGFHPEMSAKPTSHSADSPTGLEFSLDVDDEGLNSADGDADSTLKKAVVTLPEGVTANPSLAEGLSTCSEGDLARETSTSEAGDGCPEASKIGTVEVETPLLEGELLKGSVFMATPHQNPFGSLLAFYIVIKDRELGISIKLPAKITPDPVTGRLVTTVGDAVAIPQFPFSHFRFHFRAGGRSPLVTPATCGDYKTVATLTPWANPSSPYTATSTFKITSGMAGGPCPGVGPPPFDPGFTGGSVDNRAGAYSPFALRLTRRDGDQNLVRFSTTLPGGLSAKLAGTGRCSDAAIASAKAASGLQELALPSCPASSEIGHVLVGTGVGEELTYVRGEAYLAGPFAGAPLSVVGIVPAVAGPFDVGTVVTRQALRVNPRSAQVTVDGTPSDPIPRILDGIPVKVRDIRVNVDRPHFTLNPTSCEPSSAQARIWGSGADVLNGADDAPVSRADRFQAADCASLGFKPRLAVSLLGGTKRGKHPSLRGVFRPRKGDANLAGLSLLMPHSAFLDQAHIRTICTRVQFAAGDCPNGAVYGRAIAYTPLLDKPLQGPIYLRSSNHNLPDLVLALHGLIDVEAVARIDSKHGGIRTTFEDSPDVPVSKVVVKMRGGKKGLIVNSTDICAREHRATVRFSGHNGRRHDIRPAIRTQCGKRKL